MARTVTLVSPLGEQLRFARLSASDALSQLFELELDVVSERGNVRPEEVLGKAFTVTVEIDGERKRHFNGYAVKMASASTSAGRLAGYRISLRPWLWFLTRTSDCKVFQNKDVPTVLSEVFDTEPMAMVDKRSLSRTYDAWEYCVQYRETDFNYVSRLMEQEGIYYFFEHSAGEHTMVLADSFGAHPRIEGDAQVVFRAESRVALTDRDHIERFDWSHEIQPGVYAIQDYDFERPGKSLEAVRRPEREPRHGKPDYEVFDYPGEYDTESEGEQYAAARIEELRSQCELFYGAGNERDLAVGRRFTLSGHPRSDLNEEYLVTSTSIVIEEDARESGAGGAFSFMTSFSAILARQTFRAPRTTPKPIVQGIQTARVVGPAGDEIHTDKHGRIRVQFHWDRYGTRDDKSSCRIRVATPWAGKGFGMVSIPRIGDEVVVSFEEGDPDRPMVTGSVYNGENAPPWTLPDNATQSGILSRSSKGGSAANANAIRFEDKKGAEELWLHAERDQRIEVEHDEKHTVGRNRTKTVQASETNGIGGDQSTRVGGVRTITVGRAAAETVALAKALTIGGAYQVTVGAVMNETVVGAKATEVGGFRYEKVAGYKKSEIGKSLTFEAGDEVVIKTGDASLTMKKDGTIEIVGKSITLKTGGGSVEIKDDGKVSATGTDTTMKTTAGRVNIDPGGIITIKGPMVRINT